MSVESTIKREIAGQVLTPAQAWDHFIGNQSPRDFIESQMIANFDWQRGLVQYIDHHLLTREFSKMAKQDLYELLEYHIAQEIIG